MEGPTVAKDLVWAIVVLTHACIEAFLVVLPDDTKQVVTSKEMWFMINLYK